MDKERIIQEFVPGKQVTLAHLIAHRVKNWRKDRRSRSGRHRHHDANARGNGDDRGAI
ncbi:propanediol utilization protein PduU [Citrobacter koseri]|uniref:Propanediol utilization protein PduU n=1 Tax=Citrobacter koseri TaxID=545 RepID=A0A2X2VNF3_CITKO|nr:propanediol utilization protein PduU [Citrobacter koseri]